MGFEEICSTGLSLGLISLQTPQDHLHFDHQQKMKPSLRSDHHLFPSLTLGLSSETTHQPAATTTAEKFPGEPAGSLYRQASLVSAVSSFSNSSVKRERDVISGEEVEVEEKVSSKMSDDQDEEGGARKKLRLTKDQSILLEESFKEHSTLNPKQKQALAKRLNLRARQVEVWFQNRRARTKLKQTEVDCELLKKCCESLTDENRRLQKEVQELKALKLTAPFYMQLSAATLTMCPSCERISAAATGGENSSKTPFSIGTKPHFYSAAC